MFCKNCGQQIDDNASVCVHCWTQVAPTQKARKTSKLSKIPAAVLAWFTLFVLFVTLANALHLSDLDGFLAIIYLLFILVLPVAIVILIFIRNYEKKPFYQKWWFWLIGAILALVFISATTEVSEPEDTKPSNIIEETTPPVSEPIVPETTIPEPTEKVLTPEEVFIDEFCASSGFSADTAKMVYDLLRDQLLCKDISFSKKHESGEFSYDINADGYVLVISTDSDKVYGVLCGTYRMYDGDSVAYTIDDIDARNISGLESTYYIIAKDIVEGCLKAPTTAEFSSIYECSMQRNGTLAAVQGHVTSQNSFGAMITSEFVVQFILHDADSWTYEATYVRIDGESFGEFIPFD